MRLFTEIEPSTYETIQELLQEGKYDSVSQFLQVAAQNQLAIEKSQESIQETSSVSPSKGINEQQDEEFRWEYTPPQDVPTAPPFEENRSKLLLFSQYYRFFPLKCALFKLAEVTGHEGGPVSVARARTYIAEEVWPIAQKIIEWEETNDIKKKNKKSTGFPTDKDRSMMRYLDHYVGKVKNQKKKPAGFGHDLGFVSFKQKDVNDWDIQLSPQGAQFVQLTNPLLDSGPEAPTLSGEEQEYIATTIQENLDEEFRFMKHITEVLRESEGSYTEHLDTFRTFLEKSPQGSDDPSKNSVRSHAAGAISRMVELGILERGPRRGWYNTRQHPEEVSTRSHKT